MLKKLLASTTVFAIAGLTSVHAQSVGGPAQGYGPPPSAATGFYPQQPGAPGPGYQQQQPGAPGPGYSPQPPGGQAYGPNPQQPSEGPGYGYEQQQQPSGSQYGLYSPHPMMGHPMMGQPMMGGYAPQQGQGYAPQQGQGYAPQQGQGYAPQQGPGAPGYGSQQGEPAGYGQQQPGPGYGQEPSEPFPNYGGYPQQPSAGAQYGMNTQMPPAGPGGTAAPGGSAGAPGGTAGAPGGSLGIQTAEEINAAVEGRLAALHAALKLTPDQEKSWPAFEQASRDLAKLQVERMSQLAAATSAPAPTTAAAPAAKPASPAAQPPAAGAAAPPAAPVVPDYSGMFDDLQRTADLLIRDGSAFKKLADAGAPLLKGLSDEQKQRFLVYSQGLVPHHPLAVSMTE